MNAGDPFVAFLVGMFDVDHYQVGVVVEQLFDILVKYRPIGVDVGVNTLLLEGFEKKVEVLALQQGFTARNGDSSGFAKVCFQVARPPHQLFDGELFAAPERNGVGVVAIEALEVASLQENHHSNARAVVGAERFDGVDE